MPTLAATTCVIKTAGNISKGTAAPFAPLKAIIVDGINCMDDVFKTTKAARERLAFVPLSLFKRLTAFIPNGVAAFPSPRIFEEIFIETASSAALSADASGINVIMKGCNSFAKNAVIPAFSATFIIPEKKHIIPPILRHNVIASAELFKIAPETSAVCPFIMQKITAAIAKIAAITPST